MASFAFQLPGQGQPRDIRRSRHGCLTCRARRKKCDERKPTCQNCARSERECQWGTKIKFISFGQAPRVRTKRHRPARARAARGRAERGSSLTGTLQVTRSQPSPQNASPSIEASRGLRDSRSDAEDTGSRWSLEPPRELPSASLSRGPRHVDDDQISSASVELQRSFHESPNTAMSVDRALDFTLLEASRQIGFDAAQASPGQQGESTTHASMLAYLEGRYVDTLAGSLFPTCDRAQFAAQAEHLHSSPHSSAASPASSLVGADFEARLLQEYMKDAGHWGESMDPERWFTVKGMHLMLRTSTWKASALALTASYQFRTRRLSSESLALELYQDAVQKLITSYNKAQSPGYLASCVLLAVCEMMTSEYVDWRRHLEGCAALFQAMSWNASTGGLVSACFWVYARMDIWAAFCKESTTLLPTAKWFDDEVALLQERNLDPAAHAGVIVLLFAQVVNFAASHGEYSAAMRRSEWRRLRAAAQTWTTTGSEETEPLCNTPSHTDLLGTGEKTPFDIILFTTLSSVTGWTMYHVLLVMLLEIAREEGIGDESQNIDDLIYEHARSACGIISSNYCDPCLVNSIQALWICGRNLREATEKLFILHLLNMIQKETGWSCEWRMRCLRRQWGLEC